ncbi:AraC family transcriptional regulator [Hahella sp. CCB-MM4]|nr:AraC family transcriptional regulator [Hahella sp. CCB-MM4]
MMNTPVQIYMLVLPRVHLLDLAAPAQIFAHEALQGQAELHYISPSEQQGSHQGLKLADLEPLPEQLPENSWLLLIGTSRLSQHISEPEYQKAISWLHRTGESAALVAGICSGTLLAARAGLLEGKRCTTHHELIEILREMAPRAKVQEDCIFIRDERVWSSAGITTGLDLCLQLVSDFWGHDKALSIARGLVLYQRRSGHEQQLSFWLNHRNHIHSRVHKVQDMIMSAPGHTWTLSELAAKVHLSERHLSRLFSQATGHNLQDYLQQARVELARQLLEQTRLSLDEIAERCGFQAERSLRRTWSRWMPDTPSTYRRSNMDAAIQ